MRNYVLGVGNLMYDVQARLAHGSETLCEAVSLYLEIKVSNPDTLEKVVVVSSVI